VKILKELEGFLPALGKNELDLLEKSISRDGQLSPIQLAKSPSGKVFIIDGHHRYRICKKLGKKPVYNSLVLGIDSTLKAKEWMVFNRMAKKNLSKQQVSELVALEENITKDMRYANT